MSAPAPETNANTEPLEISAQVRDMPERGEVTVYYDMPVNLDAAVDAFGHDAVYSRFKASLVIDIQAAMRGQIKKKKTDEEIQTYVGEWKPGVKVAGKSTKEKVLDLFGKLSEEERAELLARFGG